MLIWIIFVILAHFPQTPFYVLHTTPYVTSILYQQKTDCTMLVNKQVQCVELKIFRHILEGTSNLSYIILA